MKRFRPWLLALVALAILVQLLFLSPKPLEQAPEQGMVSPKELITSQDAVLAPGIPENRIADYTIDGFRYVSIENSVKQWRMLARRAFLYNEEKLIHSVQVTAHLYDTDGKITVVTGKEAKYFLDAKDIEIFGDVKAVFPDGFEMESPYLKYHGALKNIEVPVEYLVLGRGKQTKKSESIDFAARGLHYDRTEDLITLNQDVRFTMVSRAKEGPKKGELQRTSVESDQCRIERDDRIAFFSMNPERKAETRYVQIHEPSLYAKSRRAELNYGSASTTFHYLVLKEDVFVRERPEQSGYLRYATGGHAEFNRANNQIILTDFPQVYQDRDTMTGDTIILHRDTDIVEVEHSNAYSEGTSEEANPTDNPAAGNSQAVDQHDQHPQGDGPPKGVQGPTGR